MFVPDFINQLTTNKTKNKMKKVTLFVAGLAFVAATTTS